ncbi:MAG TPA: stage V sporulation T C-terminal domain-containing protein, partial [Candidatus Angelobacter sp.]|nr:stage V sporulation T C-terminal domain-containing protein [Candidatus Angelobacter sp.]
VIAGGDPIGAVILIAKEQQELGEVEQKLSETAAGFLARQMEH